MGAQIMYPQRVTDETFEQVYTRELEKMVRLATYMIGSQAEAEEAVQDAFLKLHSKWFEVENPGGFVRTAVVNRCKDLNAENYSGEKAFRTCETERFI